MSRTVFSILDDLAQNVTDLKALLSPLMAFAAGPVKPRRTVPRRRANRKTRRAPMSHASPTAAPKKKARRRTSPALHAKRVLQGRYLGAVRPLSKANRARVKAVQAGQGYEAAIKLAQSLRK
jgi:hypothetical protein